MRDLSVLDLAFFVFESDGSPKHVAGLMKCKKPKKCPANFGRKLVDELKTFDGLVEPFNLVIQFIGWKGPHWTRCENYSADEHIFYHKGKKSTTWTEVKKFVSGLHEPVMDRSRPLWEYHLIDNIKGGYFAIYVKLHHAYADGMTMTSWFDNTLSTSPEDLKLHPIWTFRKPARKAAADSSSFIGKTMRGLKDQAWNQGRRAES